MIPEILLLAIVIGWLMRGKLTRLADAKIRHLWILAIPVAFLAATVIVYNTVGIPRIAWPFRAMHVVGLGVLATLALLNGRIRGTKLIFAGLIANIVAIVVNGGAMPVARQTIVRALGKSVLNEALTHNLARHAIMQPGTRLKFLCDIIPGCRPYFIWTSVYSIGDVITSIGAAIAIIAIMRTPLASEKKAVQEAE